MLSWSDRPKIQKEQERINICPVPQVPAIPRNIQGDELFGPYPSSGEPKKKKKPFHHLPLKSRSDACLVLDTYSRCSDEYENLLGTTRVPRHPAHLPLVRGDGRSQKSRLIYKEEVGNLLPHQAGTHPQSLKQVKSYTGSSQLLISGTF